MELTRIDGFHGLRATTAIFTDGARIRKVSHRQWLRDGDAMALPSSRNVVAPTTRIAF